MFSLLFKDDKVGSEPLGDKLLTKILAEYLDKIKEDLQYYLLLHKGASKCTDEEYAQALKEADKLIKDTAKGKPNKKIKEIVKKDLEWYKIIFINRGVLVCGKAKSKKETKETKEALAILKKLENLGVEILCCETCINALKVKLKVGKATDSKNIMNNFSMRLVSL